MLVGLHFHRPSYSLFGGQNFPQLGKCLAFLAFTFGRERTDGTNSTNRLRQPRPHFTREEDSTLRAGAASKRFNNQLSVPTSRMPEWLYALQQSGWPARACGA